MMQRKCQDNKGIRCWQYAGMSERKCQKSQEGTRLVTFHDFSVPIMVFFIRLQDYLNWRKE